MSWTALTPIEVKKATPVFLANLFFSIHYAAIVYVNSSLLEEFFSLNVISVLFLLGALGNVFFFFIVPHLLKRYGNKALFFFFVLLDFIATGGLALSGNSYLIAFFFLLFESVAMMIYFHLDIFLVDASLERNTGEIRGIDLTIANSAIALGPLLIAFFAFEGNLSNLYIISTILLIPLLYLSFFSFKLFKDGRTHPKEGEFYTALKLWFKNKDVKRITLARFFLEFFYAFMVIYVPVYLHTEIGFSWAEIGTIFTIMLLPFVLLQLPAGEVADRFIGEKELLILGFFCCGAAVLFMPFLAKSFIYWTVALFVSRIGAALIEVMTDTYFFKKVDKHDTGFISIFRLTRPVGIMAGSVYGVLVLAYTGYAGMFFTLAIISFIGMITCLKIHDTL